MNIQQYFDQKKELHELFLFFVDDLDFNECDFFNLINAIDSQKVMEDKEELEHFLRFLLNISNNHHRSPLFYNKIERIISFLRPKILQNFSNSELFNIFVNNKRILLLFFNEKIIAIDESIITDLFQRTEPNGIQYFPFFTPEIKNNINKVDDKNQEKINKINDELISYIKEKRESGENDSYICSLIRDDLVEDFISFITRNVINLNQKVDLSNFETNSFLIENEPTLIEYAAFFGSIQIFNYLRLNNVKLNPSLWLYSIHGNNPNIIHLLEENNIKPPLNSYTNCFIESIKCHHNDIANYIENNYLDDQNELEENNVSLCFEFYNYLYLPENVDKDYLFFNACLYNYQKVIDCLLKRKEEEIKKVMNEDQNKAIQQAAKENKQELLYYLLSKQTKINDEYFQDCIDLRMISIPFSITSIDMDSFSGCSSLIKISIPSSVTIIGSYSFYNCLSLEQINIPESVTFIDEAVFKNCKSLKKISIPSSVKKISNYAFYGCSSLMNVSLPFSIEEIGARTFEGCLSLKQITIPTSVNEIGVFAFYQCTELKHVIINSPFNHIGRSAFQGCTHIKEIVCGDHIYYNNKYNFL